MSQIVNNFVLQVATVNGSGSQSANNILVRSLFRMGLPVGGKNLFPSNIAGLPTWFTIRVNAQGYTARKKENDIVIAMNPSTALEDIKTLKDGGIFIYNQELKLDTKLLRSDVLNIAVPFRELVEPVSDSVKLKKLLTNVIYVGILQELLGIPQETMEQTVHNQFIDKATVIDLNLKALASGRKFASEHLKPESFNLKVKAINGGNDNKVLIDGNNAAALGWLYGGCTFAAWYPITPSSSMVESFISYAEKYRLNSAGEKTFAVIQAEDELASICSILGASWAGCRAVTATSGPGLSLMAEGVGLGYYAEIPAVIWDVQRVGPSTGLPTRTMQGDIAFAYGLSHGDTKHVLLLPSNPQECFEFGQTAFDLSERLQTPVLVLSDLDLGMNLHIANEFSPPTKAFDRGKVLSAEELDKMQNFGRYLDVDGDGITYRTLPGIEHPKASYFTRGTGHDEYAAYSEDNEVYKRNMIRLKKKFETARSLVPKPIVDMKANIKVGIVAYGTSDAPMREARDQLAAQGIQTNYLRLKALPLTKEFTDFLSAHERVYVVEQNRDAQLLSIIRDDLPKLSLKCHSILQFDGLPLEAAEIFTGVLNGEKN